MPKTIKKRIDRKTLKEGDLGETVSDIREKIKERQSTLVYSFLIFVAIVLTVGALVVYNRVNAAKAVELEYDAYKILSGTNQTPYASPVDRYNNALIKFNASYAAKKNPAVLLDIANCNYDLGNFDETIKTLKKLIDQYPDPKISSLAYYKMAMTYVSKGDMNSAINTFNILTTIKDALLQDMALFECGKTLEAMGKTEEAKGKYKELINKFPTSPLITEAKSRLGSQ
jgi:predicted negative regulator of RcsB-dependent stress response